MKYKLRSGFITQKIGGKTTIFSGENSKLFTLNDTASIIFQGLKLGWDKKKITEKIQAEYDVSYEQIEKDIEIVIHQLLEKGILSKKSLF